MLIVFIILTAAGIALLATRFIMALVATPLAAGLAMFLAAGIPNGVSEHIKNLNGWGVASLIFRTADDLH